MDTLTQQQRSDQMRRVKSHDTKPELRLRTLVWQLGLRYRKNRRGVPGNPDIAFVGRRLAIFLHGCFWHRHGCPSGRRTPKSRIPFWHAKFLRNTKRDETVKLQLKQAGWRSLVIWECELRNYAAVQRRVRKFVDA